MFSTKYTQSPTGLSNVNTIIIHRLSSYKSNRLVFKYLYKYKDKQTCLSLPQCSLSNHSGFKDRRSVRGLRGQCNKTQGQFNNFDSEGYPSIEVTADTQQPLNCAHNMVFFFLLFLNGHFCLPFTENG